MSIESAAPPAWPPRSVSDASCGNEDGLRPGHAPREDARAAVGVGLAPGHDRVALGRDGDVGALGAAAGGVSGVDVQRRADGRPAHVLQPRGADVRAAAARRGPGGVGGAVDAHVDRDVGGQAAGVVVELGRAEERPGLLVAARHDAAVDARARGPHDDQPVGVGGRDRGVGRAGAEAVVDALGRPERAAVEARDEDVGRAVDLLEVDDAAGAVTREVDAAELVDVRRRPVHRRGGEPAGRRERGQRGERQQGEQDGKAEAAGHGLQWTVTTPVAATGGRSESYGPGPTAVAGGHHEPLRDGVGAEAIGLRRAALLVPPQLGPERPRHALWRLLAGRAQPPRGGQPEAGAPQQHVADAARLLAAGREGRLGQQVGHPGQDRLGQLARAHPRS